MALVYLRHCKINTEKKFKLNSVVVNAVEWFPFLFYGSCDFVKLTVRTGQLARLSGSRNGFNITVRGDRSRVLSIRFTTDGSVTGLGFLARYVIIFGEQTINSWSNYTMTIYI